MSNSIFRTRDISPDQLRQLVHTGGIESERVEFKRELDGKKVLRTIAAMANGVGGVIVIGITDGGDQRDRQFVNVDPGTAERLVNLCDSLFDPPFTPEVFEITVDGARTLAIRVDPTGPIVRPVVVREGQVGEVYVRRGDSTREASPVELRTLFAPHSADSVLAGHTGRVLRPQVPNTWHTDGEIDLALQVNYADRNPHGSGSLSTDAKRGVVDRLKEIPLVRANCFGGIPGPPSWGITRSSSRVVHVAAELAHPSVFPRVQLRVQLDIAGVVVIEIELRGGFSIEWTDLIDLVARTVVSITDSEILSATRGTGWRPLIGMHLRAPAGGLRQLVSFPTAWTSNDGWSDRGADLDAVWEDVSAIPIVTQFFETAIADLGFLDFEADLHQQCAKYSDLESL